MVAQAHCFGPCIEQRSVVVMEAQTHCVCQSIEECSVVVMVVQAHFVGPYMVMSSLMALLSVFCFYSN